MPPIIAIVILLFCIILVVVNELYKRREKKPDEEKGKETQQVPGFKKGSWFVKGILIAIPILWLMTLHLEGFSFILNVISTPTSHIPGLTTGDMVPVPLYQFVVGGFLVLGIAVIILDASILFRFFQKKRDSHNPTRHLETERTSPTTSPLSTVLTQDWTTQTNRTS